MNVPPPFYNDLELSLAEARQLIEQGAANRKTAGHSPVVATLAEDGSPMQRVMILRHTDWEARLLRFHTDSRSVKTAELAGNAAASVLFYDPETKIQLRLAGTARVVDKGEAADAAWAESTNFARRCYLAEQPPSTPVAEPTSGLPSWIEGRMPEDHEIAPARANFAILLFEYDSLEYLYLANIGHRRSRWQWRSAGGGWAGSWLVP
ncbi:MAG: pyridoxamine 5'-phosphate oxidase family protein [Sphingorhabdus sp.]